MPHRNTLARITGAVLVAAASQVSPADGQQLKRPAIIVEAESLVGGARASAGTVTRQDMQPFGGDWGADAQLFWRPPAPVDHPIRNWPHLDLRVPVPAAGQYDLKLRHTVAPDYGRARVFVDGRAAAELDGYAPSVGVRTIALGRHQFTAGQHTIVVTVTGKQPASAGYIIGLDRIELHRAGLPDGRPPTVTRRGDPDSSLPLPELPTPGMASVEVPGSHRVLNICTLKPDTCCPEGKTVEGCGKVAEAFLAVRIRSYVPPRFTVMGKHYPVAQNYSLANIVADRTVNGPYSVKPGCRFNVTSANHAINESKTLLEKAGELATAWLAQWSSGVESAKAFVADHVADGVCDVVDDSESCRSKVSGAVTAAINIGLVSLGIPPEIPDIQQLREHGIRYLASQAASYAIGEAGVLLENASLSDAARQQLYEAAYQKAVDVLSKELNEVVPPASFNQDNPQTWGHLEPAYAPHPAHLYIEVRIRPELHGRYLQFIGQHPGHRWGALYLHDLNSVYASKGPIQIPTYIPAEGIVLPIQLQPYDVAFTQADTAPAQIPGVKISRAWLNDKFGISDLVKAQYNFRPLIWSGYLGSDYDLFYDSKGRYKFRLLSVYAGTIIDWEKGMDKSYTGSVWDAETGGGVRVKGYWEKNNSMKNYYGRIDPAPRCDGGPTLASYE